jgi:hypothetical protein
VDVGGDHPTSFKEFEIRTARLRDRSRLTASLMLDGRILTGKRPDEHASGDENEDPAVSDRQTRRIRERGIERGEREESKRSGRGREKERSTARPALTRPARAADHALHEGDLHHPDDQDQDHQPLRRGRRRRSQLVRASGGGSLPWACLSAHPGHVPVGRATGLSGRAGDCNGRREHCNAPPPHGRQRRQ